METIEISLGEADEASVEFDKVQTVYNVSDGPQPNDKNPTIWRYRTFEQLVQFLSSERLWFSHVPEFDDPYEAISVNDTKPVFSLIDQFSGDDQTHANEKFYRENSYGLSYANCWHMNDGESAALWNQYGGKPNAIAIKSTSQRLRDVLQDEAYRIAFGKVEYERNEETRPVFQKRDDFTYEQEYRAVMFNHPRFATIMASWEEIREVYKRYNGPHSELSIVDLMKVGEGVKVELDRLIEAIYVDPTATSRFVRAVRDVVSKFVDCTVEPSALFDDPLTDEAE